MVGLGSAAVDGELKLWVRDEGAGIALADQGRAFDRATRGRTGSGTGLGLAIVRAIAEAHGGRVDLVSAAGAGSTFALVLPWRGGQSEAGDSPDGGALGSGGAGAGVTGAGERAAA